MHKKLAATLAIAIFLLSTLAVMLPVQAHYTLGNSTNSYPYSINDFDPHVAGVIGYVFPGGGEDAYLGSLPYGQAVSAASAAPGYIAPWSDKGVNPPGAPSQTWYQLAGNAYAPFGAILVNSTGDLIFAINATRNCNPGDVNEPGVNLNLVSSVGSSVAAANGVSGCVGSGSGLPAATSNTEFEGQWGAWDILLPPEFSGIKAEQVVTTLTNDYNAITVSKLDQSDRYAPGWTVIQILADGANNAGSGTTDSSMITFSEKGEWYYARINGVTAPSIAGKYFFKMFLAGNGASGECGGICSPDYWVPTQNWPVLLVKGEVDPAIVYGQIFYGGYNATLYNTPLEEAGKVWLHMTTKLDPYTGNKLTGYPLVDAMGYFNATAEGRYTVEGVAPGVYDIYASAGGYPQQLIATGVTVLKGQSLGLNGYLNPGPVIHGTVYTKHGFGEEPWPRTQYIKIELYNAPTVGFTVSPKAQLVSWSPLPCIAAGPGAVYASEANDNYGSVVYGPVADAQSCAYRFDSSGNPLFNTQIGFPYQDWSDRKTATVTLGAPTAGSAPTVTTTYSVDHYPKTDALSIDEMGVGPPQSWVVTGGTTTPFQFQFGVKGEYGAPTTLDGHVPQMNATWVNGLTAGRYYARAWTTQYVQSQIDGATFNEVYFDVSAQEWAGDIAVPIDMRLTSFVNKTIYFHDTPGTLQTSPISSASNPQGGTGAVYVDGGLYDASSVLWAWNYTLFTPLMISSGKSFILFYGFRYRWDGHDYGIPAGTYTPKVYAKGYRQQTFEQVSLSLSGQQVVISDHLYRGVGFNITIYSTDFQQPRVDRNWVWPNDWVDIAIYSGATYTTNSTLVAGKDRFAAQVAGTTSTTCKQGHFNSAGWGNSCYNGVWWGFDDPSRGEHQGGWIWGNTLDVFVVSSAPLWWIPGSFDSGTYNFRAYTYGYVQDKTFTVSALKGQIADIKDNLVVGANVTVDIIFKKENIITPTAMNMSARIRVFNDAGNLVGEWMSSQGDFQIASNGLVTNTCQSPSSIIPGVGTCGSVPTSPRWDGLTSLGPTNVPGLFQFNYVPAGTSEMRIVIAGLPWEANNGWLAFGETSGRYGDPVFGSFFYTEGFQNYGILGSPDYNGGYNLEVDFVPWYQANAGTCRTWHNEFGQSYCSSATYYPPVTGLLMGESFHTVPGNPANAFGYTEAGALSKAFLGHSMSPNHLGPYMQEGMWTLPNAHLSGGVSGEWEVDLRGYLAGTVVGFTWSGEFRTISWATVSILGADNYTYKQYSYDGYYGFYTAPGSYKMTIAAPGYSPQSFSVAVSSGQSTVGGNVFLQQTNVPVPEFTGLAVVAFSALAASLYLLRRRHR